jgi:hypothetical protein
LIGVFGLASGLCASAAAGKSSAIASAATVARKQTMMGSLKNWAIRAGAKIAQISGEGNSLFREDFWIAPGNCDDGWR